MVVLRVIAGVEVAVATVPASPLALTTETEVTEPLDGGALVHIVPSLIRTFPAVPGAAKPVPPLLAASGVVNASVGKQSNEADTFVALLNTPIVQPAGTATPVPVEFLTVTVSVKLLVIMYCFSIAGTISCLAPPETPIRLSLRFLAD
jgi:hypothetical protein